MRHTGTFVCLTLVALTVGCRGEIPVVGLDAEGKMIETLVPEEKYVAQMTENIDRLSESLVPVVDADDYGRLLSGLRGVRLGLGLKGSVGLGDYWKLGGNIGFHLHFANKN